MGVGLFQLISKGNLINDVFYNPSISFYNYVYRRHTNFAIENIMLAFETLPSLLSNMHKGNEYSVKLAAIPDVNLLSSLHLIFKLPAIFSSSKYKFKWVENVGALLIKKATIVINNSVIDTITGEWLVIWNELTMPVKNNFNYMSGNVDALNNPRKPETTIRIRNNIISSYDYLDGSSSGSGSGSALPSIPSRDVITPLPFWFSKNPSLALPIFKLASSNDIYLKIEFEDIEKLYTVYSPVYNMHIAPSFYNVIHKENININNFIKQDVFRAHIEAFYVILDQVEYNQISNAAFKDYLIESISIISDNFVASMAETVNNITINSKLGVKEVIWTLKRADSVDNFNDIINYTYSIPKNNEKSIMKTARLNWDINSGSYIYSRVEEKEAHFYNAIQPYQYHSAIPRQGIYLYSFSLYPEKWFPSGFYDGSYSKMILSMTFNKYENNLIDDIYDIQGFVTNRDKIYATVYVIEYNILTMINNNIGLKYAN
jgi:hypothetical protein